MSRARIQDSPREITDAASLVEPLPGVHVRRLGADDSFATMSIRGSGSTQVMVYLAGVPLTGGADPTLDLATLPLWPGTQARVYRSFAPAALGRGSLGGTLVLDPPSPRARPQSDVWTAVGSFGQARLRVGDVRGDPDDARVAVGFSGSRADDDFSYLDRDAQSFTTRANAGHAAANGLATVALPVRIGERRGALTTTFLAQARKQELPGSTRYLTPFQSLRSNRLLTALELTFPVREGTFGLRAWGRREGIALRDHPANAALQGPSATDDAIIAAGGSGGYKVQAFELRVDGSAERYAPGDWTGGARPPGARRGNVGIAGDANDRIGDFTLAASVRGDAWVDSSDTGPTRSHLVTTGHVGGELALGDIAIAMHAGMTARPPSFVELYGNAGGFIGNADLRRESASTVDIGARYAKRRGDASIDIEAALFGTWADDLIVFVPNGAYGRGRAANISRARVLGSEASVRARLAEFSTRVSHTALATANLGECRFVGRECERPPLPGRPEQDLVVDVTWEHGIFRVRYGIDVVTGMRADTTGDIPVPARILHSAGAKVTVPFVPGLSIALDMRNLFDLRTGEVPGFAGPVRLPIGDLFDYPLPGRRFLVSARWAFPGER